MNSATALAPVVLMILCGWAAAKFGWIHKEHLPSLANLVFMVLLPALLFRSMTLIGFDKVDYYPPMIYLSVAVFVMLCVAIALGRTPGSFIIGLGCIFSNHMMIGIPLVALAYGQQALITVITLVSIHALVLLSLTTVCVEWGLAKAEAQQNPAGQGAQSALRNLLRVLGKTIYRAVVHPVILPIVAGMLWSLTGWELPQPVDKTLLYLGQSNGAVSLILVGATLAYTKINADLFKRAFFVSIIKTLIFPILVFAACWFAGIRGLPLVVLSVVSGLPVGNNVYLLSARYRLEQDLVTASMALTVVTSVATLAVIMTVLGKFAL